MPDSAKRPSNLPGDPSSGRNTTRLRARVDEADWVRYVEDSAFRKHVDLRVGVTLQWIEQNGLPRQIGHVGSGVGLMGHLLASEGLNYVGVDADAAQVVFSRVAARRRNYPASAPRFEKQPEPPTLPLNNAEVDLLLLFDQMGTAGAAPEPFWREAFRVVKPNGVVIVVERRTKHQAFVGLIDGVRRGGAFEPDAEASWDDPARDMVVVARRVPQRLGPNGVASIEPSTDQPGLRRTVPTVRVEPTESA